MRNVFSVRHARFLYNLLLYVLLSLCFAVVSVFVLHVLAKPVIFFFFAILCTNVSTNNKQEKKKKKQKLLAVQNHVIQKFPTRLVINSDRLNLLFFLIHSTAKRSP